MKPFPEIVTTFHIPPKTLNRMHKRTFNYCLAFVDRLRKLPLGEYEFEREDYRFGDFLSRLSTLCPDHEPKILSKFVSKFTKRFTENEKISFFLKFPSLEDSDIKSAIFGKNSYTMFRNHIIRTNNLVLFFNKISPIIVKTNQPIVFDMLRNVLKEILSIIKYIAYNPLLIESEDDKYASPHPKPDEKMVLQDALNAINTELNAKTSIKELGEMLSNAQEQNRPFLIETGLSILFENTRDLLTEVSKALTHDATAPVTGNAAAKAATVAGIPTTTSAAISSAATIATALLSATTTPINTTTAPATAATAPIAVTSTAAAAQPEVSHELSPPSCDDLSKSSTP